MGNWNSGRRPQPTALKILRGKAQPGNEPKIQAADPSFDVPPAELDQDPDAIAEWTRVAPLLRQAGLVTQAELTALLALCQMWSRYIGAQRKVIAEGLCIETMKGVPIPNPYLLVADRALHHCHRLWSELGLTPSGRAKALKVPAPKGSDSKPSKWAGLLT